MELSNAPGRRSTRRVALVVAACAAFIILAGAMFARTGVSDSLPAVGLAPAVALLQDGPSGTGGDGGGTEAPPSGVIVSRITPDGLDLDNVELPAATYFLDIQNGTGIEADLTVVVTSDVKGEVLRKTIAFGDSFTGSLTLEPGIYAVTEVSHPEWSGTIVVTP